MSSTTTNLSSAPMKTSLYVCDFPQSLNPPDITRAFNNFSGYIDSRIARDKTGQKIAFIYYDSPIAANTAMKTMKGFKFDGANRGIEVRLSDKSRKDQGREDEPAVDTRRYNRDRSGSTKQVKNVVVDNPPQASSSVD